MKKSFQAFIEKRLPQAVAETFKKELIVAEPGSDQDERIKKLVSQSLSTAIQEYESENSEQPGEGDRPSYSTRSTDSRDTIKAAAPGGTWDCGEPPPYACFGGSVDNDAGDMGSPEELLNLSRSTTTTDSGYSSCAPALGTCHPFAVDTAGIGGFVDNAPFPVAAEHVQGWPPHDDILHDMAIPEMGCDPLMDVSPLSTGPASVDCPYSSNVSLLPEGPSLGLSEYWTCFITTDSPMYSFPEGHQE